MKYGYGLWFYVEKDSESGGEHIVCYQKEGINAGVSGMIRYFPDQKLIDIIVTGKV